MLRLVIALPISCFNLLTRSVDLCMVERMDENVENGAEIRESVPQVEASEPTKRKVLTQVIPTNRLTLPKQIDIIRAYGSAYDQGGGPVGIEDITKLVGMAPATVSQTNAFLTETGVVRKDGRRFVPAPEVQAMNRLYDVSREKALAKLGPLFEEVVVWAGGGTQIEIPGDAGGGCGA